MGEEEGGECGDPGDILSFTWRQAVAPDSARVYHPFYQLCSGESS
jgi:hypothetical protein